MDRRHSGATTLRRNARATMSNRLRPIILPLLVAAGTWAGPALSQQSPAARPGLHCTYESRLKGEVFTFHHCARREPGGRLRVEPGRLRDMRYNRYGLSEIAIDRLWYVIRRDGVMAPVMSMDNWADAFANGLARSPVGNRIGYIDRSLKLVIPARYDGAFPFEHGTARVCIGCTTQTAGEYSSYVGGHWGCIDRHGRRLEPLKHNEGSDITCPATR
jgi:hypothetical protein